MWLIFRVSVCLAGENRRLKGELEILGRRLDEGLAVMEDIAERDNNFYRVMLQADRITDVGRYAGLERESRYEELASMADNALVKTLSDRMNLLDRELYVQIKSLDQLRGSCRQAAGSSEACAGYTAGVGAQFETDGLGLRYTCRSGLWHAQVS